MREQGSNLRPPDYEPGELPLLYPAILMPVPESNRYPWITKPGCYHYTNRHCLQFNNTKIQRILELCKFFLRFLKSISNSIFHTKTVKQLLVCFKEDVAKPVVIRDFKFKAVYLRFKSFFRGTHIITHLC